MKYFIFSHEKSWINRHLKDTSWLLESNSNEKEIIQSNKIDNADVVYTHCFGYEVKQLLSKNENKKILIGGCGLSHLEVLENKWDLSIIESLLDKELVIPTYRFRLISEVESFLESFYKGDENKSFFLKDSGGNGAEGLFVISKTNLKGVINKINSLKVLPKRYILQEYVENMDLWEGKFKYNLRLYLILKANGESYLYSKGFYHVANKEFTTDDLISAEYDKEVHLTNVSANFMNKDLFKGCPILYLQQLSYKDKLISLLKQYIDKAYYFMRRQVNEHSFCLVGVDVAIQKQNDILIPKIVEMNVPPGVDFYGAPMKDEMVDMVDDMFKSIISTFLLNQQVNLNIWHKVTQKSEQYSEVPAVEVSRNKFEFSLFRRKQEKQLS